MYFYRVVALLINMHKGPDIKPRHIMVIHTYTQINKDNNIHDRQNKQTIKIK